MNKNNVLNDITTIRNSASLIKFVPGTTNNIAHNTYAFDTIYFDNIVVNAEQLYKWLKKHYEDN